jgi:hypothetical protein
MKSDNRGLPPLRGVTGCPYRFRYPLIPYGDGFAAFQAT